MRVGDAEERGAGVTPLRQTVKRTGLLAAGRSFLRIRSAAMLHAGLAPVAYKKKLGEAR